MTRLFLLGALLCLSFLVTAQTIIVKVMVLLGAIISFLTIFSTAFISGTTAAAANFIANVSWKTQHAGELDWRDLALLTSIGATIGVHYAKTGRPWFQ